MSKTNFLNKRSLMDIIVSLDDDADDEIKHYILDMYKDWPDKHAIRNIIYNVLIDFIYDVEITNVEEVLTLLYKIIDIDVNIDKKEYDMIFNKILIPLHKNPTLNLYFNSLKKIMLKIIKYDDKYSIDVINKILSYWPIGNFMKEILFLEEIFVVIKTIEINKFELIIVKLFKQISKCLNNEHNIIMEIVILYFKDAFIISIIEKYQNVVYPIIIPTIYKLTLEHWNDDMRKKMMLTLKIFEKINDKLCLLNYKQ